MYKLNFCDPYGSEKIAFRSIKERFHRCATFEEVTDQQVRISEADVSNTNSEEPIGNRDICKDENDCKMTQKNPCLNFSYCAKRFHKKSTKHR